MRDLAQELDHVEPLPIAAAGGACSRRSADPSPPRTASSSRLSLSGHTKRTGFVPVVQLVPDPAQRVVRPGRRQKASGGSCSDPASGSLSPHQRSRPPTTGSGDISSQRTRRAPACTTLRIMGFGAPGQRAERIGLGFGGGLDARVGGASSVRTGYHRGRDGGDGKTRCELGSGIAVGSDGSRSRTETSSGFSDGCAAAAGLLWERLEERGSQTISGRTGSSGGSVTAISAARFRARINHESGGGCGDPARLLCEGRFSLNGTT